MNLDGIMWGSMPARIRIRISWKFKKRGIGGK